MKDPYQVLGVSRQASQEDLKKAYRKLAKELHPDRHPGNHRANERFKEVSAAYTLVGDPKSRARFDRGEINADGQARAPGGGFRRPRGRAGGGAGEDFQTFEFGSGMEDLFADLFGSGGRRRSAAPGADKQYTLNVTFLEAARGATRRISLPDGKTLDVKIPAGIIEGRTIRLKGQGDPAPHGGPDGDALIVVKVEPHTLFQRSGDDIHLELPVTLQEAVLGAKITAPTIHGDVTMTIPPRSNTDTTLRLRGKGVHTAAGKSDGDQYVKLKVMLPDKIDPDLEHLIKRWASGHEYRVRDDIGAEPS